MTDIELIDTVKAQTGMPDYELSEKLGYTSSYICQVRGGKVKLRESARAALRGMLDSTLSSMQESAELRIYQMIGKFLNAEQVKMRLVFTCALVNLIATMVLAGTVLMLLYK